MQGLGRFHKEIIYVEVIADLPLNDGQSLKDFENWMQSLEKTDNITK